VIYMAPYYPVTVCRSDGVQEFWNGSVLTANSPKDTRDTGRKADAKGRVYTKLDADHQKTLQWKRKLGGMLMDHLGGPEHAGMLLFFRRNQW
jgi:hypothetical protein